MQKKNPIVVYTAIFGTKYGIPKQPKLEGVDFICFTDSPFKSSSWKVIKVEKTFEDNTRNNRYYKLLPHRYLQEYDTSIYIDSNFLIIGDILELVNTQLKDTKMLCFDHSQIPGEERNCVYDEYEHIIKLGARGKSYKDNPETMKQQMDRFKKEGYPAKNGMLRGSILIRKHNDPEVISLMETWWETLKKGSRRDQLSFNYAAWKNNFKITYLPGDALRGNPWFYNLGSNRKSWTKKILEYKIRKLFGKVH